MVRLRIDILDKRNDKVIGSAIVNMLLFLKRNITEHDQSPFEELNAIFPIVKPQNLVTRPDLD